MKKGCVFFGVPFVVFESHQKNQQPKNLTPIFPALPSVATDGPPMDEVHRHGCRTAHCGWHRHWCCGRGG